MNEFDEVLYTVAFLKFLFYICLFILGYFILDQFNKCNRFINNENKLTEREIDLKSAKYACNTKVDQKGIQ